MRIITIKRLSFCGTKKELFSFLINLSYHYTTVLQALKQEERKKLH